MCNNNRKYKSTKNCILQIQLRIPIYHCLLIPRTEVVLNFFSRTRRDKIPKRVPLWLISVQRAHEYITDGNEFLSLFTVLSISFIKQAQVSLHNLPAPLRPVSFSISHLSLSITTVVPRVLQSQACPSLLPSPLSLLTLHSPRLSPLRSILPQCVKPAYLF